MGEEAAFFFFFGGGGGAGAMLSGCLVSDCQVRTGSIGSQRD